jgi:two-component sensor histidine kinase
LGYTNEDIKYNGKGFDKNIVSKNSIGIDILNDLVDQIDGKSIWLETIKEHDIKFHFQKNKSQF